MESDHRHVSNLQCALAHGAEEGFAYTLIRSGGEEQATCVAASDSWPLFGVTPSAGSRLGPLSEPLEARRLTRESFSLGRSVAPAVGSRLEQRNGLSPSAPASMRAGSRPSRAVCGPSHGASPTTAPSPGGWGPTRDDRPRRPENTATSDPNGGAVSCTAAASAANPRTGQGG
jgi:hypothetical protein